MASKVKNKTAALIVNYNMPERATELARYIEQHVKSPCDLYVIDNGSDLVEPSAYTNVWIKENQQTTGGWLHALNEIDLKGKKYTFYWFIITSAAFIGKMDVLTPMVKWMNRYKRAAAIAPALNKKSTTVWSHLYYRGGTKPRQVHHIDNIAALYRASWFDEIGRFDPALTMAHGIDLETCWKARKDKRTLWIDERVQIEKITDIGYLMDRMRMSADERRKLAKAEMDRVLIPKYGPGYWQRLQSEYITEKMR